MVYVVDEKLNNLKRYAHIYHVPIILDDGLNFIIKYIEKYDVKTILEIGSAIGYSAINMALVNSNIVVTTIEKDQLMYEQAIKNIQDFKLHHRITVILGDALEQSLTGKYDLIFIDAAKGKYIAFFNQFKNNLNDHGVIVTDNLSFHGLVENDTLITTKNQQKIVDKIKDYIMFLEQNDEFKTEFVDIGDGLSISKKID